MRRINSVILVALFSLAILSACGTVKVESGGSGVVILSFELSAIEHMRDVERRLIQRAWKECPKGWDQVIDPKHDYAGGYGEKLRLYRTEGGSWGLYQAQIRCKVV